MAARPRKPAASRLTGLRKVTLTIEADEVTLERLTTLLLFAKYPMQTEEKPALGPLPWDEETAPAPAPPPLDIDFEVVRRAITRLLGTYIEQVGIEKAREMLLAHGGERLHLIAEDQLLALHEALQAACGTGKDRT